QSVRESRSAVYSSSSSFWLVKARVPHRASLFQVNRLDTQELERLGIGPETLCLLAACTEFLCLGAHRRGGCGAACPGMRFDLLGQLALQDIAATCPGLPRHGSLR